jgi:hypothetical protein
VRKVLFTSEAGGDRWTVEDRGDGAVISEMTFEYTDAEETTHRVTYRVIFPATTARRIANEIANVARRASLTLVKKPPAA